MENTATIMFMWELSALASNRGITALIAAGIIRKTSISRK